jgi:hypothetical protein
MFLRLSAELKRFLNKKHGPKTCAVCHTALKFVGTKEFHEGINFGVPGDFGEIFVQTRVGKCMCARLVCEWSFFYPNLLIDD